MVVQNGSSNKEDFAIPYIKRDGTQSLFYIDIVIKFKNGVLVYSILKQLKVILKM